MPTIVPGTSKQGGDQINLKWNDTKFHDSSLTFAEMKGLIEKICDDVKGMNNSPDAWDRAMDGEFQSLALVLRGLKNGSIWICKGLHQPNQLHYTICIGSLSSYHVYVAKGARHEFKTNPLGKQHNAFAGRSAVVPLYEYTNVGITWMLHGGAVEKKWPPLFSYNNLYDGRVRGNSFSIGNSAARGPTQTEINAIKAVKK